ncbi:MAG TPA: phosphocarrier protein HPr [Fibrobacteres bacterium]|nr:phosphocarrier protein HPr [Fibrobacterota bacterium]
MIKQEITVSNQYGIHARPAALIAKTAGKFVADVWLEKDGVTVNAKSILNVMTLAADHGEKIRIGAQGDGEKQAVDELVLLFDSGFNENSPQKEQK